ncbi:MAG: hypothetical protein HRT89_07890, partial [Lentisphaeria bacterium]|nr:hypothetical protein [Lentisphaeria bacterium]NQZ67975.1 hypothetical protein [Lentisphaeria bacterium]
MFRFILLIFSCSLFATEILLPQNRAHFLTNEMIYVSVVRQAKVLSANKLIVNLAGPHKSHMKLSFHIPASKNQFRTEHIQLNAALMRPGKYQLKITADGNSTLKSFSVISHYNKSSFRTINWGGKAKDKQQLSQGEENLGYNLFIGHGPKDDNAYLLQASVDFMSCCSMSGGHQMDLRPECDWSDPQVFQGGTMRVVRRAIMDRIRPNVTGIHFYDEAKLSDGIGGGNAHNIPSQLWAWEATYNKSRVAYKDRTKYPEQWREWSLWKLGFMDAAWKDAKFGIDLVKPELLSITDSQFAYNDLSHGYYYNVNDSLPVLLGHGG